MGKGRAPCCDKTKVKRGPWSPEEDLKLISFVQQHGHANWRALPAQAGLLRCGKSCRLRWINYLRPDVKRGSLTPEEEETIIKLHHTYGNKWSKIASEIPGRTDNEIKNVFNTHLKKRLMHHQYEDNLNSYSSTPTTSSSSPVLKKKRKKSPKTPILKTTPPVLTQPSSPTEMSSLSSSSSPIIHHSKNPTTNMITTHTPAHSLQQQQITTLNSFSHNYYCDNNTDQIMKHTAAAASSIQMTPLSPSRSCVSNSSIQNQLLSNVLPVDYNTVCDAAIHPQETSDSIDSDQMGYFNDMKFWDDLQLDNLCTIQAMGEDQQLDMLNGEDKYGSCIGGGEGINHNNNNNNNNNAGDQLRDWLTYVENVLGLDEDN